MKPKLQKAVEEQMGTWIETGFAASTTVLGIKKPGDNCLGPVRDSSGFATCLL